MLNQFLARLRWLMPSSAVSHGAKATPESFTFTQIAPFGKVAQFNQFSVASSVQVLRSSMARPLERPLKWIGFVRTGRRFGDRSKGYGSIDAERHRARPPGGDRPHRKNRQFSGEPPDEQIAADAAGPDAAPTSCCRSAAPSRTEPSARLLTKFDPAND